MNRKYLIAASAALAIGGSSLLTACTEDDLINILTAMFNGTEYSSASSTGEYFGWFGKDEKTEEIEDDIQLGSSNSVLVGSLPTKVDLTGNMPTIGNQGSYGTCVAWATAYNCRTWLYAKAHGLTTSQITSSTTFSPKDIFWALDNSDKGTGCNGTNFEYAFDKMVSRGVATMATVPYTNLGDCTKPSTDQWASEAAKYKIKSYREVNVKDKATLKQYLSEGRIVVFGAKLGDEFMYASGSSVLTDQTTFNSTGIHAYHALVLSGYDDSKKAFRVVNSWGTTWGDSGYIWVDQDFFCSGEFAYCGFVAYGTDEDGSSTTTDSSSDYDLVASALTNEDYDVAGDADSDDPTWRVAKYNVYNNGSATVSPSKDWATCLLYYNAYDANDYDILLFDFATDAFANNSQGMKVNDKWDETEAYNLTGVSARGYAWSNVDFKPKTYWSYAVNGTNTNFSWPYKMPDDLTGKYYLVLIADAFNAISESDEENNYFFLTDANGNPLTIEKGVITSTVGNKSLKELTAKARETGESDAPTAVNERHPNTYSPEEISRLINDRKASGELGNKAIKWSQSDAGKKALAKARGYSEE